MGRAFQRRARGGPGQETDVLTVGMKSVLIVRDDCPDVCVCDKAAEEIVSEKSPSV